jgi:aspartyl protease family protein
MSADAPFAPRPRSSVASLLVAALAGAGAMWVWMHGGLSLLARDGPAADLLAQASDRLDVRADHAQPKASSAHGVTIVPLKRGLGGLYAPAVIDGVVKADFVIDSGAGAVVLSPDVARALMRAGRLTRSDYRGVGGAILANGARVSAQVYNLRTLKVGGRELHNVTAMVAAGRGELLLGQSFLKRFKSWSIDNRKRTLRLEG